VSDLGVNATTINPAAFLVRRTAWAFRLLEDIYYSPSSYTPELFSIKVKNIPEAYLRNVGTAAFLLTAARVVDLTYVQQAREHQPAQATYTWRRAEDYLADFTPLVVRRDLSPRIPDGVLCAAAEAQAQLGRYDSAGVVECGWDASTPPLLLRLPFAACEQHPTACKALS
jgi:hypothetical protein